MLYAGYKDPKGYARLNVKIDGVFKNRGLHREMYISLVGEIPEGLVLDHLCRNRCCINVEHLEPVTNAINIDRGDRPGLYTSTCNRGHKLAVVGTYKYKDGRQKCKACNRENGKKWATINRDYKNKLQRESYAKNKA